MVMGRNDRKHFVATSRRTAHRTRVHVDTSAWAAARPLLATIAVARKTRISTLVSF